MAAGRPEDGGAAPTAVDGPFTREETVRLEASPSHRDTVELHHHIARRLLREGHPARAFTEMVRATRVVPMNGPLATALVRVALAAGTVAPAVTLLVAGLEETEGEDRLVVLRALVRLLRKAGELERSREYLVQLLAARPADRRARLVLNALLEREGRWEELDASLEKEAREAQRRGLLRAASRVLLRRARLWGERLKDPARAALRYSQAAQLAAEARDLESAFLLRLLHLRSLHQSGAPRRALEDAAALALVAGAAVGKADRARSLARELGLPAAPERPVVSVETDKDVATVAEPEPEAAAPAMPRRRSTQLELVAIAEAAKEGHGPEVAAVLAAAAEDGPDEKAAQKLEAHYIARGAWRELAQFYQDASARAQGREAKLELAEKRAELLEDELHDSEGAARAWAEVASLSGDARAVSEQVRLLNQKKDARGVRSALDAGVDRATEPAGRAEALVLRAEEALTRREVAAARADFEAALAVSPSFAPAAAGLAELSAMDGDLGPTRLLEQALLALPRHSAGRAELQRRLARLAEGALKDTRLARGAWTELLAELPGDPEALARLMVLNRAVGDDVGLEELLKGDLRREPRGPPARKARIELVALLERAGRGAEAVDALREAVRMEPGHQEAWLALAERLISQGRDDEAAWALEHCASATADGPRRMALWQRLSRFVRERLGDDAKADVFAARADKLKRELAEALPAGPLGGTLAVPQPRAARPAPPRPPAPAQNDFDAIAQAIEAELVPEAPLEFTPPRLPDRLKRFAKPEGAAGTAAAPAPGLDETREAPEDEGAAGDWLAAAGEGEGAEPGGRADEEEEAEGEPRSEEVMEVFSADVEVPAEELKARQAEGRPRRTQELALGDPSGSIAPSFGPSPQRALSVERQALFDRVRANPLDGDGYRMLAEHFDTAGDANRSSLMLELGRALEGDPNAAPRAPRLILSATDRAGLKHPRLRGEEGELLSLIGAAVCRLHQARGRDAGTDEEFRLDAGKGARPAADALLAAVRILGLRAPDVFFTDEPGAPFTLVYAGAPRLLVTRAAARKEIADAELRFFAGRALFTLSWDLLALRSLRREQLLRGLATVGDAVTGKAPPVERKLVREAIPARAWERVRELWARVGRTLDVARLTEGARHSSNRAGLVVCGGVAPAVAALRAKKALPLEMTELVRFAASERYLLMRSRKLGKK